MLTFHPRVAAGLGLVTCLLGCRAAGPPLTVTALVGSALDQVCRQAAELIVRERPALDDGTVVALECRSMGSGDVVTEVVETARAVKEGSRPADDPTIPTLLSLDGDLEHQQLRFLVAGIEPKTEWIPRVSDSPAFASSPMVFMTSAELAPGLQGLKDPYTALATAKSHRDLDPASADQPIRFVHTAPTRSNSGLQTLVAQFVAVSGKPADELSRADVRANAAKVRAIQEHIPRYGASTNGLAQAMVRNGPFWASVGSVYESSVVSGNQQRKPGEPLMVAVYPRDTYTSTMRLILPRGPWVSERERQAAERIMDVLLDQPVQTLVGQVGLRPANPAVRSDQIRVANGVDPQATYNTLRLPKPDVVQAMIQTWIDVAKKPSRVALVVDSSGSMAGEKLPAVARSLQLYLSQLGPRDVVALIEFDNRILPPVVVDATPAGQERGQTFLTNLKADGTTHLYDAVLVGRDWLTQTGAADEIRAVVVLTDGIDSRSTLSLKGLKQALRSTGFKSDERIAVFSVGYGQEDQFDRSTLKAMAEGNGGEFLQGTPETIRQLMDSLQLAF